ncbi:MAG: DUF4282 domain-containing protein [Eggerthellaceae bacterium]|nr:DUF4282 domain-containing protein [Eggerthellaceae bacterium]
MYSRNMFGTYGGSMGLEAVLLAVAVIAVVGLSIFCCVHFLGRGKGSDSKIGSLLNFEHLYLEGIFKVFYTISVVVITVIAVYIPLAALFGGNIAGFFIGIFVGALFFVISQFLNRMLFEYGMVFIRIAGDTRALRNAVAGKPNGSEGSDGSGADVWASVGAASERFVEFAKKQQANVAAKAAAAKAANAATPTAGVTQAGASPTGTAPVAGVTPTTGTSAPAAYATATPAASADVTTPMTPVSEPAAADVTAPIAPAADGTWTCTCGKTGNTGNFCGVCGSPRP